MSESRLRVLFVASHPVQYMSPIFRRLAQDSRLEMQVAYCSLQGADGGVDPEFGREVQWDVPLLEGYHWQLVPNRARRSGIGRFWGLRNHGLWKLVREGGFDAIVIYTGYLYASFWITVLAAKSRGVPLVFGTDAISYRSRQPRWWKSVVKRIFLTQVFRLAKVNISPSTATSNFFYSIGIPPERVVLTPYAVDNDWWRGHAAAANRSAVRDSWRIPEQALVVLFCAKLQPWKRPLDVLHAFARAHVDASYLVYAGDGPLRAELEAEAQRLGVADRVRLLGFKNQSELPAVYQASDLFVLPSEYEPFGVVVNESMLCGCVPVVSDRVGAATDLIRSGENGFVYPCGDIEALAHVLSEVAADPLRRNALSAAACRRMDSWSPRERIESTIQAIGKAADKKRRRPASNDPQVSV